MLHRLLWSILLLNLVVIIARLIQLGIERRQHGLLGQTLAAHAGTTLLYFWGPHCNVCQRLQAPALAALEQQLGTQLSIVPIDATIDRAQAERYQVLTLPTTVILRHGMVIAVNNGYAEASKLQHQVLAAATGSNQRPISIKPIGR